MHVLSIVVIQGEKLSTTIVLGAQWGDEGKGKVTDFFASKADLVVRFQGGNNAGHTIVVGDEKFALSMVPSGVMYESCTPVIGSGCVIDFEVLKNEIETLNGKNIDTTKLKLSYNAHIIMPYHKILDELIEDSLGDKKIGTTRKGIGPCYGDKIQRKGIRIQDFLSEEKFYEKLKNNLEEKNQIIEKIYGGNSINFDEIVEEYKKYKELVSSIADDTSLVISNSIKENKNILFEGAQGTLLDIDHGTYPFVTSSNTSAGNAATGSGIGPLNFDEVVGVTKAYISRVGTGPFITEQENEIGDYMIEKGAEFGTVTGRRRRCGWLDLVSLKYSKRINSLSQLFITKLDVLSGLEEIKVCIGYSFEDKKITDYPLVDEILDKCEPIYESFEGWDEDISGITKYDALPENAKKYIEFIEDFSDVPIKYISVGPERNQNIIR